VKTAVPIFESAGWKLKDNPEMQLPRLQQTDSGYVFVNWLTNFSLAREFLSAYSVCEVSF